MKLYKLTDKNDQTLNQTQWGPGVTHTTNGEGDLCSSGWLHAYTDPNLAVLLNPIHADIRSPHLWLAEGEVGKDDSGLKIGTTKLTTIKRMRLPAYTTNQHIAFAIYCTLEVNKDPTFAKWAHGWLDGSGRSEAAAARAARAAWAAMAARAAWAAEAAAARAAARAAWAAAAAARAAKTPLNLIELAKKAKRFEVVGNDKE